MKTFYGLLPKTLEFRMMATLLKGNGSDLQGKDEYADDCEERDAAWIAGLSAELKARYNCTELLNVLDADLRALRDAGIAQVQAYFLINALLGDNLELSRDLIDAARADPGSMLRNYAHAALSEVLTAKPAEGQAIAEHLLNSADDDLVWAAAASFAGVRRPIDARDQELLRRALASPRPAIAYAAVNALYSRRFDEKPRIIIDLAKAIHFDLAPKLADNLFMLFRGKSGIMAALTRADVQHFLGRLREIKEVDAYHTQDFLAHVSEHFPFDLIDFFLGRVELAVERNDYGFRPANYGPYAHVPLRFNKSADAAAVLAHVWAWLKNNEGREGWVFYEQTGNLFEALFPAEAGADLAQFFESKLDTASALELKLIARLLRKAGPDFVFQQRGFVVRFLDRCRTVDRDLVKSAIDSLYGAARSGSWGGKVGEPFPRDIRQRDDSIKILASLQRLSPAFQLYDMLRKASEHAIAERDHDLDALDDD